MSEIIKTPGRINILASSNGITTICFEHKYGSTSSFKLVESHPIRPKTISRLFADEDNCVFALNSCWFWARNTRALIELGSKEHARASLAKLLECIDELRQHISRLNR